MNNQLLPVRIILVDYAHQRSLAWNTAASRTNIEVTKPIGLGGELDLVLADGAEARVFKYRFVDFVWFDGVVPRPKKSSQCSKRHYPFVLPLFSNSHHVESCMRLPCIAAPTLDSDVWIAALIVVLRLYPMTGSVRIEKRFILTMRQLNFH